MNLEPAVAKTVQKKRRAMMLHEAGIMAMLAAGALALLALVIIPYSAGNTTFSPLVKAAGMSALTWAGVIIAIVFGCLGIALYFAGRHRDLAYFARFTHRTKEYDMGWLARIMNALDGIASGAGMQAPYVAVLKDPVPNAVAFTGKEGPVIGVTKGFLSADLEYGEIEAVMAHELASIATGDYLRAPGSDRSEGVTLALLWLAAVLGIISVPISRLGNSSLFAFIFALCVVALLVLASLWIRWIRRAREHDYILTDSIAVKMKVKPEAMESALRKMDKLVSQRPRLPFPESELGLKYLFMPAHRWSESAMAFLKRRSAELDYDMKERAAGRRARALQQEMDELAAWSEQLLADRLENVEAIEEGEWHAFGN
ncbi:MAG: M48 family metallopeptidase [Candidatus Geothermincolia bacterium]